MQIGTVFFKFIYNKYIWLLGLTLVATSLTGSVAFALDPMGPPTTGLTEGQYELGIDYSASTMDIKLTHGRYAEWNHTESKLYSGEAESFKLKDFKMNKIYANLGYGIWEYCDVFLRLGIVNAEFGDSIWEADEKFDNQTDLTFCIGSRATFYDDGDFKIGRMIQLSWANLDGGLKSPQWTEEDSVDIDLIEIQATIGPTYTMENGMSIYGGPFLHFIDGDIKDKFNYISEDDGDEISAKYSWNIDQASTFGGYIGIQIDDEYTFFRIEYQHTAKANSVGLSYIYRF